MAKQLHVNLSFSADTERVRSQLKGLQKDIENLMGNPKYANDSGFTKEIQKASVAAATLKNQLYEATNFRTGKLDLGHFNRSLKESGYTLKDYRLALESLGPTGQTIFGNLAKSIITAEVPVKRLSNLVTQFGTTLKNAARWQISSGLLHGLAGTMQSAVGYAKDLNSSLNSIQIVTGNSASQMAEFAAQANRSAKALSTTTNEYAKASLIFAQQGLNGSEITARTDTVIKMANVTGESADAVSSYMTAIWNNFAKGSENLEHYADVITALGASTASSSEEIANGLSKFASVADTIGLSYDYATSMLAALVANTRQSADIVGTSLRTILARLQSVQLGETLEDGVELTKYTQALDTIGVKVLDLNGELKNADTILEDVASRWDSLTQAQKAAVSQTVAG
nr:MAG TPA: minor tail protein [Caudoviricetes sp.]